jgi:predicted RNase H-like HicB family nuclease
MEVIIVKLEETETGFSSYSDDVPGCISVGDTLDEFKNLNPEEIKEKYTSFDEIKEKYNYPKDD